MGSRSVLSSYRMFAAMRCPVVLYLMAKGDQNDLEQVIYRPFFLRTFLEGKPIA